MSIERELQCQTKMMAEKRAGEAAMAGFAGGVVLLIVLPLLWSLLAPDFLHRFLEDHGILGWLIGGLFLLPFILPMIFYSMAYNEMTRD